MRIAVLSDIHANIDALEAVLAEIRREGIEHLVILGDIVGYYYEPRAVIEALGAFDCTIIQGNHDRMAIEARGDETALRSYRSRYGSGLDAVLDQFGTREWDWLLQLEPTKRCTFGESDILLAHGAPYDPDAPIYPDASEKRFARVRSEQAVDGIWLGHTHWPFLSAGKPTILNPGSVGQPRDIGGLAAWGVYHVETGAVAFHRTEFETEGLLRQVAARDPDRGQIAEVLTRRRIAKAA